ncbi:ATP-binding protein [Arsenicibacter rosenii]|uniref:histidine kinase n=1 Tax=Arsenicibacter rosenii TaxID=1750698 RepID=A0A1S2VGX0_9BACT|nr:ATP-binding protein [Arsenicibacter rosenii]OIN57969.1 histidine kinase [Arsenicibacter rosenii]
MVSLATLRAFDYFREVPDEQLQWLLERSESQVHPAKTTLYKPDDPVDHLILVVSGQVRLDSDAQSAKEEIALYGPHSVMGVLPYSRMKTAPTYWNVQAEAELLYLHRDYLREMTQHCYELTEALVHRMTARVRDFTKLAQQNEKMASLGRLSAGLAHELNNPVAAVVRSANTLRKHMHATPERFKTIMRLQLSDAQIDVVNQLLLRLLSAPAKHLSLLERSSLEDELMDWLDDHDITDNDDLAGQLIEFNVSADDLDTLFEGVGTGNIQGVLDWLVTNLVTEKLVLDISDASGRIQTLVGSIKNYTYMDRGEGKSNLHIQEGIQSTLTLLNHKLKQKQITTTVELADNLPVLCGWPGELNQVWTNLIDNAVDAMDNGGRLEITSQIDQRPNGQTFILTKVVDSGKGIPENVIDRIFDPFFTTKPIGSGTGLGLDIVQGIVHRHNGSIKVKSQPGHTEFSICLPVE